MFEDHPVAITLVLLTAEIAIAWYILRRHKNHSPIK